MKRGTKVWLLKAPLLIFVLISVAVSVYAYKTNTANISIGATIILSCLCVLYAIGELHNVGFFSRFARKVEKNDKYEDHNEAREDEKPQTRVYEEIDDSRTTRVLS